MVRTHRPYESAHLFIVGSDSITWQQVQMRPWATLPPTIWNKGHYGIGAYFDLLNTLTKTLVGRLPTNNGYTAAHN